MYALQDFMAAPRRPRGGEPNNNDNNMGNNASNATNRGANIEGSGVSKIRSIAIQIEIIAI